MGRKQGKKLGRTIGDKSLPVLSYPLRLRGPLRCCSVGYVSCLSRYLWGVLLVTFLHSVLRCKVMFLRRSPTMSRHEDF